VIAIVTGGAGFIGRHLVDDLLAEGWKVTVIDDYSTHALLPEPLEGVEFIHARVQDLDPSRLPTPDAVFHLASKVGPLGVMHWAGLIADDTIEAAAMAHRFAHGAPFIDVSTSEVYGSGSIDAETDVCTFAPGHSARKEYAVAKLAAEIMVQNRGGDVRIVRPFNVAGPGQRVDGGFVLPRFIEQAKRREPLTVYRPGTQRRAFTHVKDITEGLLAVLWRGRAGETYNLGNLDNACSILDLALEVNELTGNTAGYTIVDPVDLHGPDFREAPEKLPDARKAITELTWNPMLDRRRTILDAIG
jgi:UDP-glucose 4-epimerase